MELTEEQITSYLAGHQARGILLDTNVLLLFLFAAFKPAMIGKKRLEKYDENAGKLLFNFVIKFSRILTTPHVLAETSNLAAQIVDKKFRDELFDELHPRFCLNTADSFVHCEVDGDQVDNLLFRRVGMTDAYLAALVRNNELLLTDDLDLYVAAVSTGGAALNFTHMRESAGLFL